MYAQRRRWFLGASAVLTLVATACAGYEPPTAPNYGFIRVEVIAIGGDADLDGYVVTVGTQSRTLRYVSGLEEIFVESFYLEPGAHGVTIGNVAPNCSVSGSSTRTVSLAAGEQATVKFEVVCVPTGIALTTRTSGPDSPDSLRVTVDGQRSVVMAANGSQTIGRLTPGPHTITVVVPAHCTVTGGAQTTVSVVLSKVTALPVDVACVPVVRLPRIAYATDIRVNQGQVESWIELVNVDGTGAVRLRRGDSPAWSPNGSTLAFSDAQCSAYYNYYYYPPYCSGGLVLADPEIGNVSTPVAGRLGFHPSWAPTGDVLALDVSRSRASDRQLVVLRPSAGSFTPIDVTGPSSSTQPAWSPDGTRIAFACTWPTSTDLCLMNVDGRSLVRLSDDAQLDQHPAWSPDGSKLAFARYDLGSADDASADIAVLDLGTRRMTLLGRGTDPAWSPDGSRLVFAGADGLFVMNADGTGRTRLTTGPHHAPAWRPR